MRQLDGLPVRKFHVAVNQRGAKAVEGGDFHAVCLAVVQHFRIRDLTEYVDAIENFTVYSSNYLLILITLHSVKNCTASKIPAQKTDRNPGLSQSI